MTDAEVMKVATQMLDFGRGVSLMMKGAQLIEGLTPCECTEAQCDARDIRSYASTFLMFIAALKDKHTPSPAGPQ